MSTKGRYWELFRSTFKLSACTFGGGFVIVPLMRKRFVNELHWIDDQEMLDMVAIAQSSPGPIAVNGSILVGYHVAGGIGALVAALGTVLPPLIILSVVSMFYQAFRDLPVVSMIMTGMMAGIAAVIFDVVLGMLHSLKGPGKWLPFVLFAASFAAVWFWNVHILLIFVVCATVGALMSRRGRKEERP